MKNLTLVVLTLATLAFGGYTGYTVYDQEARVLRLASAEYAAMLLNTSIDANEQLLGIAEDNADVCKTLIERERAAAATVDGYLVENKKLKESLKEAVEALQTLTDENNALQGNIDQLNFKIATLEKALDAAMKAIDQMKADVSIQPTEPTQPVEPPTNKLPF